LTDVAHATGAHLKHTELVTAFQLQQAEGQTDQIVEVGNALDAVMPGREYRVNHLASRGFPDTARHPDYQRFPLMPVPVGKITECFQSVIHQDDRACEAFVVVIHDCKCGPAAKRFVDVVVTVMLFASQRPEHVTLTQRARVGRHAVEGALVRIEPHCGPLRRAEQLR